MNKPLCLNTNNKNIVWEMSPYTNRMDYLCLVHEDGNTICEAAPFYIEELMLPPSLVAEILQWKLDGVSAGGSSWYYHSDKKPEIDWIEYYTKGGILSLKAEEHFKENGCRWRVDFRFNGDLFWWDKEYKKVFVK